MALAMSTSIAPALPASKKSADFNLADPMLLFGAVVFLINHYLDRTYNLPVGELILPILGLLQVKKEGKAARLTGAPGAFLFLLLFGWIIVSNLVNGSPIALQLRGMLAVTTAFLPLFCFAVIDDRKPLLNYMIGNILAFGLMFTVFVGLGVAGGGVSRTLRGVQPTPIVPLAICIAFYNRISGRLFFALVATSLVSFAASFLIDARGPLLSPVITLAFFALARLAPVPRAVVPAALALCLVMHYLMGIWYGDVTFLIQNSGQDTISNIERAYAIDYSRQMMHSHPVFGSAPENYAINFKDSLVDLVGEIEQGDRIASPHNSFLEYAVFYGYPAGILLVLLVVRLIQGAMTPFTCRSLVLAIAIGGIIRMAAFYGISGWLRVEWFALLFVLYAYAADHKPRQAPPAPTA
jgi:hypothetical protein